MPICQVLGRCNKSYRQSTGTRTLRQPIHKVYPETFLEYDLCWLIIISYYLNLHILKFTLFYSIADISQSNKVRLGMDYKVGYRIASNIDIYNIYIQIYTTQCHLNN